jgi:hypothetical protein
MAYYLKLAIVPLQVDSNSTSRADNIEIYQPCLSCALDGANQKRLAWCLEATFLLSPASRKAARREALESHQDLSYKEARANIQWIIKQKRVVQ